VEIEITRGRDTFERLVDIIAQPRHVTQGLVSAELVETAE
jgi:tetraacyldisaccharide 4'-kinase